MDKNNLDNMAIPNIIKQRIIDEIMQGKIKAGDKLLETEYSALFGTSRAPVREAFYLLNLEGYVEKVPRKGTVVKSFTVEEMRDMLDIRNSLEILALDRIKPENVENNLLKMRSLIDKMKEENIDRSGYAQLNYEFHFQIIEASQSEVIKKTYSRLAAPVLSLQTISFIQMKSIKKSLNEHKEIVELLTAGDIESAKKLLDRHNRDVFSRVKDSINT